MCDISRVESANTYSSKGEGNPLLLLSYLFTLHFWYAYRFSFVMYINYI